MHLRDFVRSATILDGGPGVRKGDLIRRLLAVLAENGHLPSAAVAEVQRAVMARERLGSTGIGRRLALPHTRSAAVERPVAVLAVARPPVEFDSLDGEPVDRIVLTISPPDPQGQHLGRLSAASENLMRFLRDAETSERLRRAPAAESLLPIAHNWRRYEALHAQASPRKRQLFACGCLRGIWGCLYHPAARSAVEVAERFADGQATEAERNAADEALFQPRDLLVAPGARAVIYALRAHQDLPPVERYPFVPGPGWEPKPVTQVCCLTAQIGGPATVAFQTGLLDCLLPPDLNGSYHADPAWLAWDGGAVRRMAAAIYADRSFTDLPVLSDALEDAGCTDMTLLSHLLDPGPHARGCWAVDLLLGKG